MKSYQAKLMKAIHRCIVSTVRLETIASITRLGPASFHDVTQREEVFRSNPWVTYAKPKRSRKRTKTRKDEE